MQEHDQSANGAFGDALILTRDQLRRERERKAQGYRYPLRLTGGVAQVRIPSLEDRALMDQLPEESQHLLAKYLLEGSQQPLEGKVRTTKEALARWRTLVTDQEAAANAFCIAGFIKPRLVASEAEVDLGDPYCWFVEDVHLQDRIAFLQLCQEGEVVAANRLKPFLAEPVAPLQDQPAEQAAPAAERPAGVAGGGLFASGLS